MEWWVIILGIFGILVVLLLSGLPVAFCFTLINIVAVFFLWRGEVGLHQLIASIFSSISSFSFLPVVMFVLLGEVLFQSGLAFHAIDVVDKWLGRLPGRLALVGVGSGTLLACLSGSSMGTTAMLGSMLLPDMRKRGYGKPMSVGPLMGGGGLAVIIPPSALAVVLASTARISVGRLLMSGFLPGLLLAGCYAAYIIGRCLLQPSVAPPYVPESTPLSQRLASTVRHVLPLGIIILVVIGFIFAGVATPTESAAMGALASIILAACYRRLNWGVMQRSVIGTLKITVMIFMILTGAAAFSQVLARSGATAGLAEFAAAAPVSPIVLVIIMQAVVVFLGCFMEPVSIMMITFPVFLPIVDSLGLNLLWFGLLFLINLETGLITPPFGAILYVMKGVVPADTSMGDIIRAALPFVLCNFLGMGLIIAFPMIALLLPSFMRY